MSFEDNRVPYLAVIAAAPSSLAAPSNADQPQRHSSRSTTSLSSSSASSPLTIETTKFRVLTSLNKATGVQNRITMRKNTIDVEMSKHGRKNGSFVKQFDTEEEKSAFIKYQLNYLKKNGFDPAVESSVSLVAKDTMDIANIDVEDDSQPGVIDTGRVDSGSEGIGREDSEYESSDSDKEDEEEYKETHEEQETYDEFLNKLNKQRTTRK